MLGDMLNRRHGKATVWHGIIAAIVGVLLAVGVAIAALWV